MKNLSLFIITATAIISQLFSTKCISQSNNFQTTVGVLQIDCRSLNEDPLTLGNIVRAEVSKFDEYETIDKYDIDEVITQNDFQYEECYGTQCVKELGSLLNADKMVTGSIQLFEEKVIFTLRLLDVRSGKISNTETMEFVDINNQMHSMTSIMVNALFGKQQDEVLVEELTNVDDFESSINSDHDVLVLNGPRVGISVLTGELFNAYSSPLNEGGYDELPVFSTIGYQFEWKYLSTGNVQALVEFLPVITGIDKGHFIPSLTVLNGIRNNRSGFELAIGPILTISKTAEGYYNEDNRWTIGSDEEFDSANNPTRRRIDSRGQSSFSGGLVIAVGKTFRSGKLNIPLNAYIIPGKNQGHRVGLSAGFNIAQK